MSHKSIRNYELHKLRSEGLSPEQLRAAQAALLLVPSRDVPRVAKLIRKEKSRG